MPRKPPNPFAPTAAESAITSALTGSRERAESPRGAGPKMRKVEIIVADPEPYLVSAESPETLVQTTFALLVSRIGDKRARELWDSALKRRRGRPPNSAKYLPGLFLPTILRLRREMPNASLTQVVTVFVEDFESRGLRYGASTDATIRRLVRDFKFFGKHGHF